MRQDFKVVPSRAPNRNTEDLWEIRVGGTIRYTTIRGKDKADAICQKLNEDPFFLERGQDSASRGVVTTYQRNS